MLSANKEKLASFFTGTNQFIIPFFQRAYVWKEENWGELWDNILEQLAERNEGNTTGEHFIGTLIIKQTLAEKLGTTPYELIDGQQRLTTICLLLRALSDASEDTKLKTFINNLLIFDDSYGNSHIRIKHSKVDTVYFSGIIQGEEEIPVGKSKVTDAYIYFRSKIKSELKPEEIRPVVEIVLHQLPVIHMALNKDDDVQQIFDTINSLGVKLTTGELLKNHLFSSEGMEKHYQQFWADIFEADEEAVEFWNQDKTSGRVIRSTIELFLYSYLVIVKESAVRIESLFKQYKEHLKGKSQSELLDFAKELYEYACLYEGIPDGKNLVDISFTEHEKRFFHVVNQLDITTVFPLVLFIYKQVPYEAERFAILGILESYIVRRAVCRLTTKNYNNLFIALLVELKKQGKFTKDDFAGKLKAFTEDSSRFPTDDEFKNAFHTSHLINKYTSEILYCIALYDLNNDYQDNRKLNNTGFSLEHMMPKKWRNHWTLPAGKDEKHRDHKLLTFGNLTLVKGQLNSKMRDAKWEKKKDALRQYSTLRITTDYIGNTDWDEDKIAARAEDLIKKALNIWKR